MLVYVILYIVNSFIFVHVSPSSSKFIVISVCMEFVMDVDCSPERASDRSLACSVFLNYCLECSFAYGGFSCKCLLACFILVEYEGFRYLYTSLILFYSYLPPLLNMNMIVVASINPCRTLIVPKLWVGLVNGVGIPLVRVNEVNPCGEKTSLCVFILFAQDVIVAVNLCHIIPYLVGSWDRTWKVHRLVGFQS